MSITELIRVVTASPLPWVILAGLFVGAAASRGTRRARRGRDPDRERTRRWVGVCLLLSLAVLCVFAAVFLPGAARIVDIRLAWVGAGAAAIGFVALRFRKSLGIPVLVLALALVVAIGLFLQGIRAFTGQTQIASIRVLTAGSTAMSLELVPRGRDPVLLTMNGSYFAPIVKVVLFDDLLVFLGAKTWYRFEGLTSFDANMRQQDSDYRFVDAPGIADRVWSFFEAHEASIPGVKTAQIEMTLKRAKDGAAFDVFVQNDGGVEVVPHGTP